MQIISRKDAKASNLKRYFTGKPCKHDHVDERFVSDRKCYACCKTYRTANKSKISEYGKQYRLENSEEISKRLRLYYLNNKEKVSRSNNRWKIDNAESIRVKGKTYRETNKHKEKIRHKRYAVENRERLNEYARRYMRDKCKHDSNFKIIKINRDMIRRVLLLTGKDKDQDRKSVV